MQAGGTKLPYLLNQYSDFDVLLNLENLKPILHSLFYDRKHFFKLFGLGCAVKLWGVCRAITNNIPLYTSEADL